MWPLFGSSSCTPSPMRIFRVEVDRYSQAKDMLWCQEEPGNQGAWHRIQHYLLRHKRPDQSFRLCVAAILSISRSRVSGETQISAERIDCGSVSRKNLSERNEPCSSKSKFRLLSESVAEATLLSWQKKEGEHVDRDENLIDIETDKVVLEFPAPAAGVLAKIMKGDGSDRDKWRDHCLDRYRDPRRNRNAAC